MSCSKISGESLESREEALEDASISFQDVKESQAEDGGDGKGRSNEAAD